MEKFCGVHLEEQAIRDLKVIAAKEGKKLKDIHKELILNYVKIHKDGNPQYTIDQFEDPNFLACPAFHRDYKAWLTYLKQAAPKEWEDTKRQMLVIDKALVNTQ